MDNSIFMDLTKTPKNADLEIPLGSTYRFGGKSGILFLRNIRLRLKNGIFQLRNMDGVFVLRIKSGLLYICLRGKDFLLQQWYLGKKAPTRF